MCGLFGWSLSPEAMKEGDVKLLAAFLGVEMDSRGGDSWGIALPQKAELYRGLGTFAHSKVLPKIIHATVLGHTRKATTGKITVENAHPFAIGNTVGAHNGIIHNDVELNNKYKRSFAVDSMHLIAHIDEGKDISEVSGYGTVTYYKKNKPNDLFLGKSTNGDLHILGIGTHKNPVGLVYASTQFSLIKALQIAGFEHYFFYNVREETLYKVQDYTLFIEGKFPFSYGCRPRTTYPSSYPGYTGRTANDYLAEKKDHQLVGIAGRVLNSGTNVTTGTPGGNSGTDAEKADKAIAAMGEYDYASSRVLTLPEDVKKTQEILPGRDTQAKKVPTRSLTCYGCAVLGPACEFYAESPDAVIYDYAVGHAFCEECHEYWGLSPKRQALTPAEQKALQTQLRPRLTIVRKEDDETRRRIGYL